MRDLRTTRRLSAAALLMKDALRGARFALRRGRALMEPPAPTPEPMGQAARFALAGVDRLALGVEDAARTLGRALLELDAKTDGPAPILTRLGTEAAAELVFAQLAYRGAARALRRFGAADAMISEATAAAVWLDAACAGGAAPVLAPRLFLGLRAEGFVRDVVARPAEQSALSADAIATLALFATLLWMQVEPGAEPDRGYAVLGDCSDLTLALKRPIVAADGDADALQALFAAYADKV